MAFWAASGGLLKPQPTSPATKTQRRKARQKLKELKSFPSWLASPLRVLAGCLCGKVDVSDRAFGAVADLPFFVTKKTPGCFSSFRPQTERPIEYVIENCDS
jgi:hypothetical protein